MDYLGGRAPVCANKKRDREVSSEASENGNHCQRFRRDNRSRNCRQPDSHGRGTGRGRGPGPFRGGSCSNGDEKSRRNKTGDGNNNGIHGNGSKRGNVTGRNGRNHFKRNDHSDGHHSASHDKNERRKQQTAHLRSIVFRNDSSCVRPVNANTVSTSSTDTLSLDGVSEHREEAIDSDPNDSLTNQIKNQFNDHTTPLETITVLVWPNPHSHYIPIEDELRLLPALIHWGKTERGMMKDQPSFRLDKIRKLLERCHNPSDHSAKHLNNHRNQCYNRKHRNNHNKCSRDTTNAPSSSTSPSSPPTTIRLNLLQSLSLRRHHLKLLNPTLSMSALRLGHEDDIREAAQLFEHCIERYLKSQGVPFSTEREQKQKFEAGIPKGVPFIARKQPPTPDFLMNDGHCVVLSFAAADGGDDDKTGPARVDGINTIAGNGNGSDDDRDFDPNRQPTDGGSIQHPIPIFWIEAKMFYGASTVPHSTPNAVGCILPKARDYVSLYGSGAMVFMYGCGKELARQLREVGVVALDGRGLDLTRVERQQRRWCADGWGNILF